MREFLDQLETLVDRAHADGAGLNILTRVTVMEGAEVKRTSMRRQCLPAGDMGFLLGVHNRELNDDLEELAAAMKGDTDMDRLLDGYHRGRCVEAVDSRSESRIVDLGGPEGGE